MLSGTATIVHDLLGQMPKRGLEAAKRLFWAELNYDRVSEPLSMRDWPERSGRLFATDVCRNCDARFACDSYRAFAELGTGRPGRHGRFERDFLRFFSDYGPDEDLEDIRDDNPAGTATPDELEALI